MNLRKEIGLLLKLSQGIEQHQYGAKSFEFLCDLLEQTCNSLYHLSDSDRDELNSFKNSFEVLQLRPKFDNIDTVYEYSSKISEREELAVGRELILLTRILHKTIGKIILLYCPSCGYDLTDLVNNASLSELHCPCCGIPSMFFYGQQSSVIKEFRNKWLIHPTHWYDPKAYFEDWSFEQQVENIPLEMT